MALPRTNRRLTLSWLACAALVAIVADAPGAEVLSMTSADGVAIETNRLLPSTRFVGAAAIWVRHSYPLSVDCSPPRACYAYSQLVNYHFSCRPRFIIVAERISMDLNGDVVNHYVMEAVPTTLPYVADHEVLNRFCGIVPDPEDLPWRREPPERGEKPQKGVSPSGQAIFGMGLRSTPGLDFQLRRPGRGPVLRHRRQAGHAVQFGRRTGSPTATFPV